MPADCLQLNELLTQLKSLLADFEQAINKINFAADYQDRENKVMIAEAWAAKERLENQIRDVEHLFGQELRECNLAEQYAQQVEILKKYGVLEELADGKIGIKFPETELQEYIKFPLPKFEEISERIREREKFFSRKARQGFTKLVLVPFGIINNDLIVAYERALTDHKDELINPLDGSKHNLNASFPVMLDTEFESFRFLDLAGDLLYGPRSLDIADTGAKTKQEMLERNDGWQIMLLEDLPSLPWRRQAKTVGGRKQIEAPKRPAEYLALLRENPSYEGEQAINIETWICYAMKQLEEKHQVIDDMGDLKVAAGTSSTPCMLLGSIMKDTLKIPAADWSENSAYITLDKPEISMHGLRTAVEI